MSDTTILVGLAGGDRVQLSGLGALAYLESQGGTIDAASSPPALRGMFRLVFRGIPSDAQMIAAGTTASGSQGNWTLASAPRQSFYFSTALLVQDHPAGPSLIGANLSLTQLPGNNNPAFLSIDDVRTSLVGHLKPSSANSLLYPTAQGSSEVNLLPVPHPANSGYVGFFIVPVGGSFQVLLGNMGDRINIDHGIATQFVLHEDCALSYGLAPSATTFLIDASTATQGALVLADDGRGIAMASDPGQPQWSALELPAAQIEARDGWMRVVTFVRDAVWIGRVEQYTEPVSDATGIYTSTDRLTYELAMPRQTDPAGTLCAARLIYRSTLTNDLPVMPADRHFGVRVRGLGSRQGPPNKLDADVAVFDTVGSVDTCVLHLKAGAAQVPVGDTTEQSNLLPKVDPASKQRQLDIPVGLLSLSAATSGQLALDTSAGEFVIHSPELDSPPLGVSAHSAAAEGASTFARWVLAPGDASITQQFRLGATLAPIDGSAWLEKFSTKDNTQVYALIEHPGASLRVDAPLSPSAQQAVARLATRSALASGGGTKITTKPVNGKEVAVYSAFFAGLSYFGYRAATVGVAKFLDPHNWTVAITNLDEPTVKRNAVNDLCIVNCASGANADSSRQGIRDFIDTNRALAGGQPQDFAWPFAAGLSILLYQQSTGQYADQIAMGRRSNPAPQPSIALEFSAVTALDPTYLGWPGNQWTTFSQASSTLWPRASGRSGARLDPSDKLWRGIFFRDLPLFFPVSQGMIDAAPFLKPLLDGINNNLMLDYGWHDESGATWSGGLKSNDNSGAGIKVSPDSWNNVFELFVSAISVKGAASNIVAAEGSCLIRLNQIKRTDADGTQHPLELSGTFVLDLSSGGNPVPYIVLTAEGAPLATDSVPGFKAVALRRVVITKLTTAQFDLDLLASDGLAQALPAFSTTKPQPATLTFDLTGQPAATLSLTLPSQVDTNLFGRWPITLEAISITFANPTTLAIRGRIHLGLPPFTAVGCWVSLSGGADGVKFGFGIDEIDAKIDLGSMSAKISLKWADDASHDPGPVPLDQLGTVKNRDFYGSVTFTDTGLIGQTALVLRIGNVGELSFWIACIESGTTVNLGVGQLRNPALLFAHHAERGNDMSKAVTNPSGSVLSILRPTPGQDISAWLAAWKPDKSIGTLIAASGYLQLDDKVAAAPNSTKPEDLTSVLFTDTGLFRVDAVAMVLGTARVRFGIAVDFDKKTLTAGIQAPSIKLPDEKSPQYVIDTGYISLGIGFGGTEYLSLHLGWPDQIGGTEFERDWSKSVKVIVTDMEPINTFWGGLRSDLDGASKTITMGWAIRAGWTKTFDQGFAVVSGHADLGITLGGVFQFQFAWGRAHTPAQQVLTTLAHPASAVLREADSSIQHITALNQSQRELMFAAALVLADAHFLASGVDVRLDAELFGDIWGDASVVFMGVTLAAIHIKAFARFRACGSFSNGIVQAKGTVGFEVSVQILCVTFSAQASLDITLIDNGPCPFTLNGMIVNSPEEVPLLLARPENC